MHYVDTEYTHRLSNKNARRFCVFSMTTVYHSMTDVSSLANHKSEAVYHSMTDVSSFANHKSEAVYRGFRTKMVYLDYITCLRYAILVRKPRYIQTCLSQFRVPVISQKKTCNFRPPPTNFQNRRRHTSPFHRHLCKSVRRKPCRETLFGCLSFDRNGRR